MDNPQETSIREGSSENIRNTNNIGRGNKKKIIIE